MAERVIGAAEFKARCLQLMEEVRRTRQPLVVTERGKPLVRLMPAGEKAAVFGALKGTVTIHGDIVAPTDIEWEADRRNRPDVSPLPQGGRGRGPRGRAGG